MRVSPHAQQRIYALEADRLRELDAWVSRYREFWTDRLDSLALHLDGKAPAADRRRTERP